MKPKKLEKRLLINKVTIANLSKEELISVNGGVSGTYCVRTCPTPESAICPVSVFNDCLTWTNVYLGCTTC